LQPLIGAPGAMPQSRGRHEGRVADVGRSEEENEVTDSMKKRPVHPGLWLLVLLCVFILPEVQRVDAADDALPPLPRGIFAIHLETYKSRYRVNETIGIRVAIRNNSSEDYVSANLPVWVLCSLAIFDEQNKPVQGGSNGGPGYRLGGAGIRYRAGTTEFMGSARSWPLVDDWAPLDYWGYALGTGTYTITAVSNFTTWTGAPNAPRFTFSESSNSVKITVQ
jgi:hypothetical protein